MTSSFLCRKLHCKPNGRSKDAAIAEELCARAGAAFHPRCRPVTMRKEFFPALQSHRPLPAGSGCREFSAASQMSVDEGCRMDAEGWLQPVIRGQSITSVAVRFAYLCFQRNPIIVQLLTVFPPGDLCSRWRKEPESARQFPHVRDAQDIVGPLLDRAGRRLAFPAAPIFLVLAIMACRKGPCHCPLAAAFRVHQALVAIPISGGSSSGWSLHQRTNASGNWLAFAASSTDMPPSRKRTTTRRMDSPTSMMCRSGS